MKSFLLDATVGQNNLTLYDVVVGGIRMLLAKIDHVCDIKDMGSWTVFPRGRLQ